MAEDRVELRPMQASLEQMHGTLGCADWAAPVCVVEFDADARPSTGSKAHEYNDTFEVLQAKVALLAKMVRQARQCVVFTGAGISTAAGIDDYATKAKTQSRYQWTAKGTEILAGLPKDHPLAEDVHQLFGSPSPGEEVTVIQKSRLKDGRKWEMSLAKGAVKLKAFNWMDARPTQAHKVLTTMYEEGLFKNWVQQNHDSLPQKAGYPQHALNEIHGSLHDPANPVIEINGFLRGDLSAWLEDWSRKNDLCLALGTSLSGFNVDRVPQEAADRALRGKGLGLVMVNLQQTQYDELSQLRIFGKLDQVMTMLAEDLGIADKVKPSGHVYTPQCAEGSVVAEDVFLVPFDEHGRPSETRTTWDLRVGQFAKITGGPYEGNVGQIVEKSSAGHYRILCKGFPIAGNAFADSDLPAHLAIKRDFSLWLGNWWLEEATKGFGIMPGGKIPVVTVDEPAKVEKKVASESATKVPVHRPKATTKAPPPPPKAASDAKGKGKRCKGKESGKPQATYEQCYAQ